MAVPPHPTFRPNSLRSTTVALLASAALAVLSTPNSAWAACAVTSTPNSVTCAINTTTTATTNTDAGIPNSNDQIQKFTTGGDVTGAVSSHVIVDGNGLKIDTSSQAGAAITFGNAGSISNSTAIGLDLATSGAGQITYTCSAHIPGFTG